MSRYGLIQDIRDYLQEAQLKNYSEHIIQYDLNRMLDAYDADLEKTLAREIQNDILEDIKFAISSKIDELGSDIEDVFLEYLE